MWDTPSIIAENQHIEWSHKLTSGDTAYIPCWSVGRLIEIIDKCEIQTEAYQNVEMHEDCTSQGLIDILKCETGRKFDFSKLN